MYFIQGEDGLMCVGLLGVRAEKLMGVLVLCFVRAEMRMEWSF